MGEFMTQKEMYKRQNELETRYPGFEFTNRLHGWSVSYSLHAAEHAVSDRDESIAAAVGRVQESMRLNCEDYLDQ